MLVTMSAPSALLSRVSATRSLSAFIRFPKKTLISEISPSNSISRSRISDSTRRISRISSAIASARLNSILSAESQSWGLIPQGNSMPL